MQSIFSRVWIASACLTLCLLASGQLAAQARPPADSLDMFLTSKMNQLRIPGLQLAVIRQGRVVKLASYGLANIQDSVPVGNQTRFTINSITKAFTGVAVMQLVETGKLDLAMPVSRYLDSLPESWHRVTVRQLLTHTSGIPDIMPGETMIREGTDKEAWATLQSQPLVFTPGQGFQYNQTNYLLLGKILEKLSGRPFDQFVQERQLNPVGMPLTQWGDAREVIAHSARGYSYFHPVDGPIRRTDQISNIFEEFPVYLHATAGLNSTAEEMAQWIMALQAGKMVSPSSLITLWTPGTLNDGRQRGFSELLNGYALGWLIATRPEHRAVASVGGGRSAVFIYPDDSLAVVVLTNMQGASPENFLDEIASYYIPDMRAATGFGLPASVRALNRELLQRGFAGVVQIVKKKQRQQTSYHLPEADVNAWGYTLLGQEKRQESLAIFRLNAVLYPQSANANDSLAECYALLGLKELAVEYYRRSLALDPQNRNAMDYLKKQKTN